METRLRQRVIGGIVLAALAVIFLPLFFKESSSNPSSQQASVTEQIPAPPPAPNGSATTVVQMTDPGEDASQKTEANLAANTNPQANNDNTAAKPREPNDNLPVAKNPTVYDQNAQPNDTPTADQAVATTQIAPAADATEATTSATQAANSTPASQAQPAEDQAPEATTKMEQQAVFNDVMPDKKKHAAQKLEKAQLSPRQRIAVLDDQENLNKLQTEQSVADETSKEVEKVVQKAGKSVVAKAAPSNETKPVVAKTTTKSEAKTVVVAQNNEEDLISKNMNDAEEKILSAQKNAKQEAGVNSKKDSPRPPIHEVQKNPKGAAWVVQLGCFGDAANAKALADQLQSKGFPAYMQKVKTAKGGDMIRVLVGPETERNKAVAVLAKLDQQLKLKGVIVPFDSQQIK